MNVLNIGKRNNLFVKKYIVEKLNSKISINYESFCFLGFSKSELYFGKDDDGYFYFEYKLSGKACNHFTINIECFNMKNEKISIYKISDSPSGDYIEDKKFFNKEFNDNLRKIKTIKIEAVEELTSDSNYLYSIDNKINRNIFHQNKKILFDNSENTNPNPNLFNLVEEDLYFKTYKDYNYKIDLEEIQKYNNVGYCNILELEYYEFTEKIKCHYKINNNRIIKYINDKDKNIYADYIINTLNGEQIIVYDVIFKDTDDANYFNSKHCYTNIIKDKDKDYMFAILQIDLGIFFYSSLDGCFLIKDMKIDKISDDYTTFTVKPINENKNISYIQDYNVLNISKNNVVKSNIVYYDMKRKLKPEYSNCPNFYFYFKMDYSIAAYVLIEYAKKNLKLDLINNIFDDDGTENYMITIVEKKRKYLPFIFYVADKITKNRFNKWNNPYIYDISCKTIISYATNDFIVNNYYNDTQIKQYVSEIIDKIKNKFNFNTNVEVAQFLYDNFVYESDITDVNTVHLFSFVNNFENKNMDKYLKKYNDLKDSIYKSSIIESKWKNEYNLYKHVRHMYSDAIYQYKAKWLRSQSLDIFIPSIKLAIEYQGIQHYKPIDHFGGEEGYEERERMDETKKYLCKINNIKLIQWKYNEFISTLNIQNKINKSLAQYEIEINYDLVDEFVDENPGHVECEFLNINKNNIKQVEQKIISFSIKKSGNNSKRDRIIELSAVLYEYGAETDTFNSIIYLDDDINDDMIYNRKVINGKLEEILTEDIVSKKFTNFLGNTINNGIILFSENPRIDIEFLSKLLIRQGVNAKLVCIDMKQFAKKLIKLEEYNISSIANYFNINSVNIYEDGSIDKARIQWTILSKLILIQRNNYDRQVKRPIIQYTDDMNIVKKFESISSAARETGINQKSIRETANGKQNHAGGYIWKYEID